MIRIARIIDNLGTNDDRRAVAFEVWRTYGGTLPDLRRAVERERKAAQRDASDSDPTVPDLLGQNGDNSGTAGAISPTPPPAFQVPESIRIALSKSDFLGRAETLRKPEYWKAEIRAYPGVDYAKEVLKAEAWCQSHPQERPRKRVGQFIHRWLSRADREE